MSHKATNWAMEQRLPALQKLVLICLADRHNKDTGRCFPKIKLVAEDAGMSESSVKNALRELVDKGLIEKVARHVEDVQLSNEYVFAFDKTIGPGQNTPPDGSPHAPTVGHDVPTNNQEVINQEDEPTTEREQSALVLTPSAVKKKIKAPPPPFELPGWIDPQLWEAFMEVRRSRKAAQTDYAFRLLVKSLEAYRARGHDPNEVIAASVRSSWTDVYEPKTGGSNGNRPQEFRTSAVVREESNLTALQRVVQREREREQTSQDRFSGITLSGGNADPDD